MSDAKTRNLYAAPHAELKPELPTLIREVGWGKAIKVWWSWIWRATLWSVLLGFLLGAIVGGVAGALIADSAEEAQRVGTAWGTIAGWLGALPAGVIAFRSVLRKQLEYCDFKIALIAK
jgi:hypothetical protein